MISNTVVDYQVLFVNDRGKPKKMPNGAQIIFTRDQFELPSNYVVGTKQARPILMWLTAGDPGSVVKVHTGFPEKVEFSCTLDAHFRTLMCPLDAKKLKEQRIRISSEQATIWIANVVLMYQVKIAA